MAEVGRVFVICGPSGAGKSTLIERLFALDPRLRFSVSMTTRPRRPGETEGEDYYFVSDAEFDAAIEAGELLEWAHVHEQRYGTPRREVAQQRDAGHDVVLDIDVQGADQIRESGIEARFIFIMPPSIEVLEQRLRGRRTETDENVRVRLLTARKEIAARGRFDYEVTNDRLDDAVHKLQCIVEAERCRIRRAG